jgi:hypothetical protein
MASPVCRAVARSRSAVGPTAPTSFERSRLVAGMPSGWAIRALMSRSMRFKAEPPGMPLPPRCWLSDTYRPGWGGGWAFCSDFFCGGDDQGAESE